MSEARRTSPPKITTLKDALHQARLEEAERSDVIVELHEAERARLELLFDDLAPLAADIPDNNDLFALAIIPGEPPRLWVDVIAHVRMGPDKRTYRFVREARHGREVLCETMDRGKVAEKVTDYVARRIIERERALAGGPVMSPQQPSAAPATISQGPQSAQARNPSRKAETISGPHRGRSLFSYLLVFLLGAVVGTAGLLFMRTHYPALLEAVQLGSVASGVSSQ